MSVKRHVGLKRLEKLAAFLRKLPPKRFDYNQWVGSDWKGKPDLSCGTTACALGWAAAMPAFNRIGLKLRRIPSKYADGEDAWNVGFELNGNICTALEAASETFGISWDDASHLFMPNSADPYGNVWERSIDWENASAKQVARKIEQYVKDVRSGKPRHFVLSVKPRHW